MKRTTLLASLSGALLFSATAFGISSAVEPSTLMSRTDYNVGKSAIESDARVAAARCRDLEGNARDVCKAEARAEAKVRKADLSARYYGTVKAANEARAVRARAHYDVAKTRCGERADDERGNCISSARAERDKAVTEAKSAAT
jgi:hypothetical protein